MLQRTSSLILLILVAAGAAWGQTVSPYVITTLVGSNPLGDGGPATSALLEFPQAVAVDSSGNVYIADGNVPNEIRKVTKDGTINVFVSGYYAYALVTDAAGNVYFATSNAVYKASPAGSVTKFAGGTYGYGGDEGPATAASLNNPDGLALDAAGNLYIADTYNCRIREVTTDGKIHLIAGSSNCGSAGNYGSATSAQLNYPVSVAVDSAGGIYVGEHNYIRKIAGGTIAPFAGGGNVVSDGALATEFMPYNPWIALDHSGNLYFTDGDNHRVRMIANGTVTTVAGTLGVSGFSGDQGPATFAKLNYPNGIALDSAGNLYISDNNNCRIRMVDTSRQITTLAGATHLAGDQGPATSALLHRPEYATKDSGGNLYVSDYYNHAIRKVTPDGKISTVAGNGTCGYIDNKPAQSATLCYPNALAFDSSGNLYVADGGNDVVRRIDTTGFITTYAGNGKYGDTYDGSQATSAQFRRPYGLAVDSAGNLYVSDGQSNRVHKVASDGTISRVAGTGTSGYSGDGTLATSAQLNYPGFLAMDGAGNLFISDNNNGVVREISGGIITTVAGIPTCCGTGKDATHTYIGGWLDGVAVDSSGNLYISSPGYSYVYSVNLSANTITKIAGNNSWTYVGDGGIATATALNSPRGLWVDAAGDVYVADLSNNRIRKLTADPPTTVTVASGDGQTGTVGATLNALAVSVAFRAQVPVAGIPVTFAVTSGDAALTASTANTDSTGSAGVGIKLGKTPGAVVVTASMAGLPPVQFHLTAVAIVPFQLNGVSGNNQSGTVGAKLPNPLVVGVLGSNGASMSGVTVTFSVTSGSAQLSASSVVTGSNGQSSVVVTLGATAGPVTVTATAAPLPSVVFNLTAVANTGPQINAGGIVGAGLSVPAVTRISANAIVSIFGQNFAPAGSSLRSIGQGDLVAGKVPTQFAGICVEMNSVRSPIFAVTPSQLNVQVPAVPQSGNVTVQVIVNCGQTTETRSAAATVAVQAATPEFFFHTHGSADGRNPVAAINAVTGGYIGAPNLIPGATFVPARAGDFVTIFMTGLGATTPSYGAGVLPPGGAQVSAPVSVSLGGVQLPAANVPYTGVAPGNAGLYQVNIQIPAGTPTGNLPLTVTVGSSSTPAGGYLTIGQ